MPSRAEVVGWLEDAIRAGAYGIAGKLPSESELMDQYDASRNTVRDALRDLQAAGIVESRTRLGWYLRADQRRDYLVADVSGEGWDAYCAREGIVGRRRPVVVDKGKTLPPAEFEMWEMRDVVTGEWQRWALALADRGNRADVGVLSRAGEPAELNALELPRRSFVLEVDRAGDRYALDARRFRLIL